MRTLAQEEAARLVNEEEIRTRAVELAEQSGIVFIDEIDKVASRSEHQGADVSRQGVQRDLLPLIEGTAVTTRTLVCPAGITTGSGTTTRPSRHDRTVTATGSAHTRPSLTSNPITSPSFTHSRSARSSSPGNPVIGTSANTAR